MRDPLTIRVRPGALVVAVLALAAGGCAMSPAADDPVMLRLESLERRLDAIERILANGSLVDLTLQMDALQRQAAELQGRIERIEYDQEGSAERQRSLYADLDDRIQSLESGLQRAVSAAATAGRGTDEAAATDALPVPGGTDQENYQAAFELLKEQRYEQAAAAFSRFLASYPESQLADNAQYWLAEAYYVTDEFERALAQFQIVLDRYPRSRKVPDALLKIGYCNYELERWPDARIALSQVRSDHPDTTAARLAEQRLRRMTEEGH
jgi:tol-pal system protein YbgF